MSSAVRTSMPASTSERRTRSSSARPVGPTSAVVTRSATDATAPTWSRSKCVSTSRSTRSTPRRSRQAPSRAGSSPTSTSAVPLPPRTSTASPCPTSHAATAQSPGSPARTTSRGTATDTIPTAATVHAARSRRKRTARGARTATATEALTTAAPTTPSTPAGQGAAAYGSAAAPCAMPPIALAGAHATAASTEPPHGHSGAVRHAASPTTVTIGASGSVSRFAGTA
ncbi:hypothetical protein BIV03_08565 [Curtobacterium sp. MCBA15_016]|nr:hypothetical protein BIV03_08565 [Curtobacterium sp. MCBA15_016]